MESKSLIIGIVSFIAGALLVSTAATTFDKPEAEPDSMSSMVQPLADKSGDRFDEEFLSQMIVHHEGAIDMAKLAQTKASHAEVKKLSENIIAAQEAEIRQMKQWQTDWGYIDEPTPHRSH